MTTPADELRTAADKLRDHLVSAATDGPWHVVDYGADVYGFEAGLGTTADEPNVVGHGYEGGGFVRLCDAEYAAAMHPGVGQVIAHWLADEASNVDADGGLVQTSNTEDALTIARLINRSQP